MIRTAVWVGIANGLLVVAALLIGAAQPILAVGYVHRVSQHFDLFVHDLAQDLTINLTRTPEADEPEWDWSPDGLGFAYTYAYGGQAQICVLKRTLTCILPQSAWDQLPHWSPDGMRVGFLTHDGNLAVYDTSAGEVERYPARNIGVSDFSWSPDGTRIAYVGTTRDEGRSSLYMLELDTRERRQITDGLPGVDVPQWSPDGSQLLFSMSGGMGRDVMLADSSGGQPYPLTRSGDNIDPVWSVDGTQVMYLSWSRTGTTWMLHDLATDEATLFMRHQPALDSDPVWSSDGSRIGFISYNQRYFSIWMVDINAAASRMITSSRDEISELAWHP
jgi:Tol biopolymer transport system component